MQDATLRARSGSSALRVFLAVSLAVSCAAAQRPPEVTPADVQRLQDDIFEAATDLARLRTGDAVLLGELRARLNEIRDDVASLDARVRRRPAPTRAEYVAIRNRLDEVRRRARNELTVTGAGLGPAAPAPDPQTVPAGRLEIPVRTELDVRLLGALDPSSARTEDRVEAATVDNLEVDGRVVVPAGALVRGLVAAVSPGTPHRPAALMVRFDALVVSFRTHRIEAVTAGPVERALASGSVLRIRFDSR